MPETVVDLHDFIVNLITVVCFTINKLCPCVVILVQFTLFSMFCSLITNEAICLTLEHNIGAISRIDNNNTQSFAFLFLWCLNSVLMIYCLVWFKGG